jgi:hypothetical protein
MNDNNLVWRYMGFARFVWLLQKKRLWLSRVDKFEDEWELALAGEQLEHVYLRRPFGTFGGKPTDEPIRERTRRVIMEWRERSYVNCWCALPHESHALWRVFCGPSEGVAIQTTLGKLKANVSRLAVRSVIYDEPGRQRKTPELFELLQQKRKMFEYEHEVLVIGERGIGDPRLIVGEFGIECPFEPEVALETVRVHPQADTSFLDTVVATVGTYAPKLLEQVKWSSMRDKPPLFSSP